MKKTQKIIILGSAGLVGMNLLSLLKPHIQSGTYAVTTIDKNEHNIALLREVYPEVNAIEADLAKKGSWEKEFKNADVIIQLQAQISSPYSQKFVDNNVTSVKHVLAACKKYHINNLIHLSSSVVISVANDDYTNTKKAGQILVEKSGIPYTILRPPLMYGCFDAKHLGWITRFMKKIPFIFPIPGNGKYMRQPLYVLDLCRIIMKLIEEKRDNKIYDIIGKEKIDYVDLLKIIAKERKIRRIFVPIPIPIFIFAMQVYSIGMKTKPFIPEQLRALTAGDDFPIHDWESRFKVKYTPFRKAIKETVANPNDKYSEAMMNPN